MQNRRDYATGGHQALRDLLGVSQEHLARELGVSYSTISRWELGKARPSGMAKRLISGLKNRMDAGAVKTAETHEPMR